MWFSYAMAERCSDFAIVRISSNFHPSMLASQVCGTLKIANKKILSSSDSAKDFLFLSNYFFFKTGIEIFPELLFYVFFTCSAQ
jgi:hypothetical protein